MALDNLISVTLTDDEVNSINEAIDTINNVLKGKVVNLTPEERRQYGSIADTNKVLVDKCKNYMEQNPDTVPMVLDKAEFDRDYKARRQMEQSAIRLTSIMEKLLDTKTLLDHDNYQAAIAYYRYIKYLSQQNEPGTTSIYQDLSQHYKRPSKVKEEATDTTTTTETTSTDQSE